MVHWHAKIQCLNLYTKYSKCFSLGLVRLLYPNSSSERDNFTCHNMSRVLGKPAFCICDNKDADQLRGNREADQRLCFATWIEQSLYFLNPKFQASSHLLWLYSLVFVGPGRKLRRPVFSQRGSYVRIQ